MAIFPIQQQIQGGGLTPGQSPIPGPSPGTPIPSPTPAPGIPQPGPGGGVETAEDRTRRLLGVGEQAVFEAPSEYILGLQQTLDTMTNPQEQQNFVQALREKLLQRLYRYETSKARGLELDNTAQADYDTIKTNLASLQSFVTQTSAVGTQAAAPGARTTQAQAPVSGTRTLDERGNLQSVSFPVPDVPGAGSPEAVKAYQGFLDWKQKTMNRGKTWEEYQKFLLMTGGFGTEELSFRF